MPNPTNPIQRFVWEQLSRQGLDLVDDTKVAKLVEYAKSHVVTQNLVQTSTSSEIDAFEKAALKGLLEDSMWRSLLTDDGVHAIEKVLGISAGAVTPGTGVDAIGSVPVGTLSRVAGKRFVQTQNITQFFNSEVAQRSTELFGRRVSADQKAKNLLFLLQDYAKILNAVPNSPEVARERLKLLKAFFEKPDSQTYGSADPDNDLFSNAWEIVYGLDPERAEMKFEIDESKEWYSYMSMNGEFLATAELVDKVLEAKGKPALVKSFEAKSPLNWIIGDVPGNTKPSSYFSESRAISSTGVDFASKLVSPQAIGNRTLEPGFDLNVDFYAYGQFVSLDQARGERLVARAAGKNDNLKVEVQQVGASHWKPIFKDATGNVVDSAQVTLVVVDARGRVKGDGVANGSYSASWWGFCDRNALTQYLTTKFKFPRPERAVTIQAGTESITFSVDQITQLVSRRLTELFEQNTFAGSRFDQEPDQVVLRNGETLSGKILDAVDFYRAETDRIGDSMVLTGDALTSTRGTVKFKSPMGEREISADDITEISRPSASANDPVTRAPATHTLKLKDGSVLVGELVTKLNFRNAIRQADGRFVLTNSAEKPIRGEINFQTFQGESKRVLLDDINYMVREDENEILAEEALAYIIKNKGIFCADSWSGSSVANGKRIVQEVSRWAAGSPNPPQWVPADLANLKGHRGQVKNPKNLLFFNAGNGSVYGGLRFWIEVDDNRNPINSGSVSGSWDFLWGVAGEPNWNAKPTFNPNVPNDLVSELYVKSLNRPQDHAALLPKNWQTFVNSTPVV